MQQVVPSAGSVGSTQTFTLVIDGDTNWCLRAMSASWFTSQLIYLTIEYPDGKFLANVLMDDLIFAGYGSNRLVMSEEIECPPNSKIQATFDTNLAGAGSSQNIMILFEGAYKYYLKNVPPPPSKSFGFQRRIEEWEAFAESMPRYLGHPNQNIMAPCWMQGYGPGTPHGFEDVWYTYDSGSQIISGTRFPGVTIPLGGSTASQAKIQIQLTSDFTVRKLYFWIAADATVTGGSILARIRLSTGYAVTNDYIDVFKYISGACLPCDLTVKAGDQIFFDLSLVDGLGSGNMYFAAFAEGCKRWDRTKVQGPIESDYQPEVLVPAGGGAVRTLPPGMGRLR